TLLRKVELYLANGSQAVWVVYPEAQVVYVYHSADDGSLNLRKYAADSTLDGGAVLPGFTLQLSDIFS
ncbi:MAG: Uma2 family endonuclease, partial [Armatimonadetes bacterium]|nr:Uma2 family endonuclease [Anaerolineae bacterium]